MKLLLLLTLALASQCMSTDCPGGGECPSDETCCTTPTGQGCCPYSGATCCSDGLHCCPSGMTCDLQAQKCVGGDGEVAEWMVKVKDAGPKKFYAHNLTVGAHTCPDHKQTCPGGYTCCAMPDSGYGCCPFNNAVCCGDKIHCCPEGQTCDLEGQRCTQKITAMSTPKELPENDVNGFCPDHSQCSGSATCCPIGGGHYGCCPLVAASCCNDLQHCCPHGTVCTESGFCVRQNGNKNDIPLIFKLH